MTFSSRAALAVLLACLTGCATTPPADAPLKASLAQPEETAAADATDALGPERTASGLFMAGAAALREGKAREAAQYFDRATEMSPEEDRPYLRERAFTAAVMAGDIEHAARTAPTQSDPEAYRLGRLVIAVDKLAGGDAQTSYDMLNGETFGPTYRAVADLIHPWAALAAGNVEAATARKVSLDSPQQAFSGLNQALVLEVAGRPAEAGPIYAALSDRAGAIAPITMAYGAYLERQGMRREAAALYTAFLGADPGNASIMAAHARASSRRGKAPPLPTAREGAAQAVLISGLMAMNQRDMRTGLILMRLSLRLDPARTDALMMAGDVMSQGREVASARAIYRRIPPGAPEYMAAQARIITGYQAEDDEAGAIRAARELAAAAPREWGAQILLAEVLRAAKDYDGSVKALDRVIAMRGKSADWSLYYARAISRDMGGDWPAAEKDLLRAYAMAPEESEVLNYLGYSWADRGQRLPEALELLQKAAARDPNSGAVIDSLGWAYFRMGEYDEAVEHLERAVELMPAAADINDHLGDVYAKVGRTLEARYQWQRVLTLDADDALRTKVQAKIDATPEPAPIVAASEIAPETASIAPEIAAP